MVYRVETVRQSVGVLNRGLHWLCTLIDCSLEVGSTISFQFRYQSFLWSCWIAPGSIFSRTSAHQFSSNTVQFITDPTIKEDPWCQWCIGLQILSHSFFFYTPFQNLQFITKPWSQIDRITFMVLYKRFFGMYSFRSLFIGTKSNFWRCISKFSYIGHLKP